MSPLQIAGFRAHSTSASYRRRFAELQETIATRVDLARGYVSFSAGKDSSVIAHAIHAAYPHIPILMVDPGIPYHWTDVDRETWLTYARENDWPLVRFPWDKDSSREVSLVQLHESMFADLRTWADARGRTQRIMGMRQQESPARAMLVASKGDAYDYVAGGSALLPIARWRVEDVWSYIVTHDVPWLSIYDAFGPETRGGVVGRNMLEHGRIARLKEYDPDAYLFARERIDGAQQFS
jgi:3'-phosphoadenosine 5'-phosphosulfate sulfotransferase (PAPS reductase)/FAD synthetase